MAISTKRIGVFTIAATYVGTIVGAGFATGREVLIFFTHFGWVSVVAIVGATTLFAYLGARVLVLGHELQAESHRQVVEAVVGPLVGRIIDWVIIFFLFVGAAVMMAGSGAVFAEHWRLNRLLGTVIMALLSGSTVLLGLRGVVASISAVAPLLIAMVIGISTTAVLRNGIAPADWAYARPEMAASPFWPVSMLLYVSYNLLLSIPVLARLGRETGDRNALRMGGLAGGVALGIGILFINMAMLAGLPLSAQYEVPMLFLARQMPGWVTLLYSVVLWAEVYTTAVASLYGLGVRLADPASPQYRWVILAATIGALALSQLGFARMVGSLFPLVGWLGLAVVGGLLFQLVRGTVRVR